MNKEQEQEMKEKMSKVMATEIINLVEKSDDCPFCSNGDDGISHDYGCVYLTSKYFITL